MAASTGRISPRFPFSLKHLGPACLWYADRLSVEPIICSPVESCRFERAHIKHIA